MLLKGLQRWLNRYPETAKRSRRTGKRSAKASFRPRLEVLEYRTLPSTFTVLNLADSGTGSLRAAVLAANANPGPDVVEFAKSVKGTITLTTGELLVSGDLKIDGPGTSKLTVNGNDASRVFDVVGGVDASTAITVSISGLTIRHGRADVGGGIYNSGFSDLTLARVVLSENVAIGQAASNASGGAVRSFGSGASLSVLDSQVVGNSADGRLNAIRGAGGGINVQGGRLSVVNSTVADNRAIGGNNISGGFHGNGAGGGIAVTFAATAAVTDSIIRDNQAIGGAGGGPGDGGGILAIFFSSLVINHSTLTRNQAIGGDGGLGQDVGFGGAIDVNVGSSASISDSTLMDNRAIAGSGGFNNVDDISTSTAFGGAISNSSHLEVTRSTLRGNQAIGGNNGTQTAPNTADVGSAHGGAIANTGGAEAIIRDSAILYNKAIGGNGNTGNGPVSFVGAATGAGIDNSIDALLGGAPSQPARLTVINTTLAGNEAIGGNGNTGSGASLFLGAGLGGGIANYLGATTDISGSSLRDNKATGGNGGLGAGGGIFNALGNFQSTFGVLAPSIVNVSNSTLEHNQAHGGDGHDGGNAGNGLGGGAYNDGTSSLTLTKSTVTKNQATGGVADDGGSDGQGIGGGVYNLGTFAFDQFTVIRNNRASTSHDDIFG
jgi:hypothetical protein